MCAQMLREGIDKYEFRPHYIDCAVNIPYGDTITTYAPSTNAGADDHRRTVTEFFDSGRRLDDGSAEAGGTFKYRSPTGARGTSRQNQAQRKINVMFTGERSELNIFTLVEKMASDEIDVTYDDFDYYGAFFVKAVTVYFGMHHITKQDIKHSAPTTARGISEAIDRLEVGPVARLCTTFEGHSGAPQHSRLYERQEVIVKSARYKTVYLILPCNACPNTCADRRCGCPCSDTSGEYTMVAN